MADLELAAPTPADVEQVRMWRNADETRATLRTPYLLTHKQQAEFYERVVSNREVLSRWWSFKQDGLLVAFGGLIGIEWENGHAEISLVVDPEFRGQGIGKVAVRLILREAFGRMRLLTVVGEVYTNNPAAKFWLDQNPAGHVVLPRRKWWDGKLHASVLFWFVAPGTEDDCLLRVTHSAIVTRELVA